MEVGRVLESFNALLITESEILLQFPFELKLICLQNKSLFKKGWGG